MSICDGSFSYSHRHTVETFMYVCWIRYGKVCMEIKMHVKRRIKENEIKGRLEENGIKINKADVFNDYII